MASENEFDRRLLLGAAGLAGVAALSRAAAAGPLDPPAGPITSTGKTLTEVEPRIAINTTNTPGTSSTVYRISQPGSYYLTGNVTGVADKDGMTITAPNVTIDLNGFVLQGVSNSGAGVMSNANDVRVHNGVISGWGSFGVRGANQQILEALLVVGNIAGGIDVNDGAQLIRCTVRNNTGAGVRVAASSFIDSCVIQANHSGVQISSYSLMQGCLVSGNLGVAVSATGLGVVVRGNTIRLLHASTTGLRVACNHGQFENNVITGNNLLNIIGLQMFGNALANTIQGNVVTSCSDNHVLLPNNRLHIVIAQLPEVLDAPCTAALHGSLTGISGQPGITIAADGVTIDLAGFSITGVAGAHDGINVSGARRDIAVRNGAVRGWPRNGVNFENSTGSIIENIRASQNTFGGIVGNHDARILNCTSSGNTADNILVQGENGLVSGCTANNAGGNGIYIAGSYGFVKDCVARNNGASGIRFSQRSKVQDCVASNNQSHGIHANYVGQITGCFCNGNRICGIFSDEGGGIDIIGNSCSENGGSASGAGIRARFGLQRIENNNLAINHRGLDIQGGGNIIMRNSAIGNSNGNYVIANGNTVGPIVSGDPASAGNGAHPMVNYNY